MRGKKERQRQRHLTLLCGNGDGKTGAHKQENAPATAAHERTSVCLRERESEWLLLSSGASLDSSCSRVSVPAWEYTCRFFLIIIYSSSSEVVCLPVLPVSERERERERALMRSKGACNRSPREALNTLCHGVESRRERERRGLSASGEERRNRETQSKKEGRRRMHKREAE